jgi:hypothetical protein
MTGMLVEVTHTFAKSTSMMCVVADSTLAAVLMVMVR